MYAVVNMQADCLKTLWGKVTRPSPGVEMPGKAVASRGLSISLACRTFEVSETGYSAKLQQGNQQVADLLIRLILSRDLAL